MARYLNGFKLLEVLGLTLLLFIFCSSAQSNNLDPVQQKQIDDLITNWYLPISNTSKLALAIVRDNGEVIYSTGYGMAGRDGLITNQTQFVIGSITKSITSVLTIKVLHEKFPEMGESVLDMPIRKLLPSVNFTLIDRFRSEHVSFRDLVAHRTCLFGENLQMLAEPFNTTGEITYRQRYDEEMCGIRSQFQYHNQMYIVAGELIGILANKPYKQLMNEFLGQLGMNNSNLTEYSDDFSNIRYRAKPFYVVEGVSYPGNTDLVKRIVPYSAAGGLFATPNDMIRYMRFHLNRGSIDGIQIVPEDVMAWITKPSITETQAMNFKTSDDERVVNSFGYGLGFWTSSYDGWQHWYHAGFATPYASLVSLFPEQKLGIFTTSNESPALVNAMVLHPFIFDVLKGTPNAAERMIDYLKESNKMNIWEENPLGKWESEMIVKKLEEKMKINAEKENMAMKVENVRQDIKKEKELRQKRALLKLLEDVKSKGRVNARNEDVLGKYGHGNSGDLEILEQFNNQTNKNELYVVYGNWHHGWLLNIDGTSLYQCILNTDGVQDLYATGQMPGWRIAEIYEGTLAFYDPVLATEEYKLLAKFQLGVSLDILPPVPWTPDSCGPQA